MKKNIELHKIGSQEIDNNKQSSSRTPNIGNAKAASIGKNSVSSRKSPNLKNMKKIGVSIPVYRRKKVDSNYDNSTNDASSYYSKNMPASIYKKKYHKPVHPKPPLNLIQNRRMDNSPSLPVIVNSLSMSPKPTSLKMYSNKPNISKPSIKSTAKNHHSKISANKNTR